MKIIKKKYLNKKNFFIFIFIFIFILLLTFQYNFHTKGFIVYNLRKNIVFFDKYFLRNEINIKLDNNFKWREYQICSEKSPAKRKKIEFDENIKFKLTNIDSNLNEFVNPGWLASFFKIKQFNILDFFNSKQSLYYFHGDFNNDRQNDLLVFQKKIDFNKQLIKLFFKQNETLIENKSFSKLNIICRHEQILIADFDNDKDLDIYIICYSDQKLQEEMSLKSNFLKKPHSFFLINDGKGNFSDMSKNSGLALYDIPVHHRPEGAVVLDFNNDGWLDIYVAGKLFINNKNNSFNDKRKEFNLPFMFDEGVSTADINNDGYIDLIVFIPHFGPRLFFNKINKFIEAKCFIQTNLYSDTGMNVYDVNMDGWTDILYAYSPLEGNFDFYYLSLGSENGFYSKKIPLYEKQNKSFLNSENIKRRLEAPNFMMFNNDLKIDLLLNNDVMGNQIILLNETKSSYNAMYIEMVDSNGIQNQQGRKITLQPINKKNIKYSKIVDAGSGYLNQNMYPVIFYSSQKSTHLGKAFFSKKNITFSINPGEKIRVYENGKVEKLN